MRARTRTQRSIAFKVAVMALTAAVLTACSTAVTGTPIRDPGFDPLAANPALMRPGNYPTSPGQPPEHTRQTELIIEGQRMADYVVGPWEIDPALVEDTQTNTLVLKGVEALSMILVDPGTDIGRRHGFVNGFVTQRFTESDQNGPGKVLGNAVFRFPNPEEATRAADEMAAQLKPPPGSSEPMPIPVPGHPEARAITYTGMDGRAEVWSFAARGIYVLHQQTRAPGNPDVAVDMVAKTLDLQGPRIDEFTPTDPSQFATMDLDPTGLIVRTLPADNPTVNAGVWTARANLNFQYDPIAAEEQFTASGVDEVSMGKTRVYQARDAAAATALAEKQAAEWGDGAEPGPTVPGLPAARCFLEKADAQNSTYGCVAPADRWVITATSLQDFDVTQLVAAQYLLLVGK